MGATVSLEYDEERIDQYHRTLAGVRTSDDTLVNAEIVRKGPATAVVFGSNDRFYPLVHEALQEPSPRARPLLRRRRLHHPRTGRDRHRRRRKRPAAATQPAGGSSGDLNATAGKVAPVVARVIELENAFAGEPSGLVWAALSEDDLSRLATTVTSTRVTVEHKESDLRSKAETAERREAAEAAAERERQGR